MKTIAFISHYNAIRVNVRLSDDKAKELMNNQVGCTPIELYNTDCDRVAYGYTPLYFSKSQIKRLNSYLLGTDYYDAVEIIETNGRGYECNDECGWVCNDSYDRVVVNEQGKAEVVEMDCE